MALDHVVSLGIRTSKRGAKVFKKAADDVIRDANRMGRATNRNAKATKGLGKSMALLAGGMFGALGAIAALKKASSAAIDFGASMTKIETLVGINVDVVNEWSESVRNLSLTTGRASKELAEALFVVTSAGVRGKESLEILEAAAQAASIGLGETKDIARVVTAAMQAWGKETLSAAAATDILVSTVREGNLEAADLAGSLGRVLGIAEKAGVSFAQVGGFVATFTRLGVGAEEAVTALRGVLSKIIKPTKDAEKALALMGTSAAQLRRDIGERGLAATLIDLVQTSAKFGDEVITRVIPNVRALSGVLGVTGKQAEAFLQIEKNVIESTGILGEAFKRWAETPQAAVARMTASIDEMWLIMGEKMLPAISEIAEKITILAQSKGTKFFETLGVAASAFLKVLGFLADNIDLVAAAVTALIGLKFLKWLTVVTSAIELMSVSIGIRGLAGGLKFAESKGVKFASSLVLLTNPFTLVLAAVIAATGAVLFWKNRLEEQNEAIAESIRLTNGFASAITTLRVSSMDGIISQAEARAAGIAMGEINDQIEETTKLLGERRNAISRSEFGRSFEDLNKGIRPDVGAVRSDTLQRALGGDFEFQNLSSQLATLNVGADSLRASMTRATVDGIDKMIAALLGGGGGGRSGPSLKDALEEIVSSMDAEIVAANRLVAASSAGAKALEHQTTVEKARVDLLKALGDGAEDYADAEVLAAAERIAALQEEKAALVELAESRASLVDLVSPGFAPEPLGDPSSPINAFFADKAREQRDRNALISDPVADIADQVAAMTSYNEKAQNLAAAFGSVQVAIKSGKIEMEEAGEFLAEMSGMGETFRESIELGTLKIGEMLAALKEGPEAFQLWLDAQDEVNKGLKDGEKKFEGFSQEVQVVIAQAFADIINGTKDFGEAMVDVFAQIGAAIGGAIGFSVGGPAGAAVGQIAGGVIGGLIGNTLFGGATQTGQGNFSGSSQFASGESADEITSAFDTFRDAIEELEEITGGVIGSLGRATIKTLSTGEVLVKIADNYERQFTDMDDALKFLAERILSSASFSGVSEDVQQIIQQGGGDLEQILDDVAFALGVVRDAMTPFEQELKDLADTFRLSTERLKGLGLSTATLDSSFLRDIGAFRDELLGIEKTDLQRRRESAKALNAIIDSEIAGAKVKLEGEKFALEGQLALIENRRMIEEIILRNMANFTAAFGRLGGQFGIGLASFLDVLGIAAEKVIAIRAEIARLESFIDSLEALRINLGDIKDVEEAGKSIAETLRDEFETAFQSFTAFDSILDSLIRIVSVAEQLRGKLDELELSSSDTAKALAKIIASEKLQILQIRQNVLGQLLGFLSEESEFNQQRADLAKAQLDLEFSLIEAQLRALGIWQQFADTFNAAFLAGVEAIREAIDGAADGLRDLIDELTGKAATPAIGFTQAQSDFFETLELLKAGDATPGELTEAGQTFLDLIDEVFGTTAAGKAWRDVVLAGLQDGLASLPGVDVPETIDEGIRGDVLAIAENIEALEAISLFSIEDKLDDIDSHLLSSAELLAAVQREGDAMIVSTLLMMLDSNEDGRLSIAEAIENGMSPILADLLDANKDGWIDNEEILGSILRRGDELDKNVVRVIDTNRDGFIDSAERLGFIDDTLAAKLDLNYDGLISIQELIGVDTDALLDLLDSNKNGILELGEINFLISNGVFDRLDANKDGVLDLVELQQLNNGELANLVDMSNPNGTEDRLDQLNRGIEGLQQSQEAATDEIVRELGGVRSDLGTVNKTIISGDESIGRSLKDLL